MFMTRRLDQDASVERFEGAIKWREMMIRKDRALPKHEPESMASFVVQAFVVAHNLTTPSLRSTQASLATLETFFSNFFFLASLLVGKPIPFLSLVIQSSSPTSFEES